MKVEKADMEKILGCSITDGQLENALQHALRKQKILYERSGREAVLGHKYLISLIEEYVRCLALSAFTVKLWKFCNMEKEHLARSCGAQNRHSYCKCFHRKSQ